MSDVQDRDQNPSTRLLRRGIRTMDKIVIATTFAVMLSMFLFIRHLNYVDILILNLIHSIDIFQSGMDWREGALNMFFGLLYVVGTFELNLRIAFPCMSIIVLSWIASCHSFGYPHVSWMYSLCLVMWVLKFLYKRTPDAIVVITVLKAATTYIVSEEKGVEDFLFVLSYVPMHLALFTVENFSLIYVFFSYLLVLAWMYLRSHY